MCVYAHYKRYDIRVNPLSMGNREDPARLVFTSKTGPAVATSLVDLGNRFRSLKNELKWNSVYYK